MSRLRTRVGIPAWDQKLKIASALLGAYTDKELVDILYPNRDDSLVAGSVLEGFRKWKWHRPTKQGGPKVVFERLVQRLNCVPGTTGVMLVDASLESFINLLPPESQALARDQVALGRELEIEEPIGELVEQHPTLQPKRISTGWKTVLLYHQGTVESIAAGIQAGKIDQRHYYLTPDAADDWKALVNAEAYPTYDQCKAGLRDLVASPAWADALAKSSPTTAVMLTGGGAPTKDLLLLRSLLSQPGTADKQIDYFLIDISVYMLINSMRWLENHIRTIPEHARVELNLVWDDTLNLRDCRSIIRRGGNVVFGMTGGTIGNLSERAFFKALERVCAPGDLLVLSADTLDGLEHEEVESQLKKKYDHDEVRNFIAPVVRSVISQCELPESVASALKRVTVDLRRGDANGLSDVSGSWSVTLSLLAGKKNVNLISSTRYQTEHLIAFAATFHWELVCKVPSPLNAQYVQFCFRRKQTEK